MLGKGTVQCSGVGVARKLTLIEEVWEVLWSEVIFLSRPKKWAGVVWTEKRFSQQQEVWQRCEWEHDMFKELKLIQDSRIRKYEWKIGKRWLYRDWQRQGCRGFTSRLQETGFSSKFLHCIQSLTRGEIRSEIWLIHYLSQRGDGYLFQIPHKGSNRPAVALVGSHLRF